MRRFLLVFCLIFAFIMPVFSKIGNPTSSFLDNYEAQKKLEKKLDKKAKKQLKKQEREAKRREKEEKKRLAPRMVETKQDWLVEAQSVPRVYRESSYQEPEVNKNLYPLEEPMMYFVKYNDPPGEKEVNLDTIKRKKFLHSDGVSTEDFKHLAYVEYSFNPEFNQITSELFVLPLNEEETRLLRLRKPNLLLADREFTYTSGKTKLENNMASAITIVDWKNDGSALLLKEKIGSLITGLYRTNVSVVYFDDNGTTIAYQVFLNLERKIKNYWKNKKGVHLNFYRWDIKPLGWSCKNPDEIIVLSYAYTKDNKKNFLGAWSVNYLTGEINLLSLDNMLFDIAISGIVVKYELDR